MIPELKNSRNHCRNPGGTSDRPWCFTSSPSIRWEYCPVPQCGETSVASGVVFCPLFCCWWDVPPRFTPSLFVSGKDRVSGSPADAARPPPHHRVLPSLLHVRHHHRPVRPRGSRPLHHPHPRLPQTEEAVEKPEEVGHTWPAHLWPRLSADSALVPAE